MIENTIARLFESKGLGAVLPPITPVSGGLMHRMYRVNTAGRAYAVKHLNPKEYALITMRYLSCDKWDKIIKTMHANRATVFRLHQALLQRLVLPENAINVEEELQRFEEQQSGC